MVPRRAARPYSPSRDQPVLLTSEYCNCLHQLASVWPPAPSASAAPAKLLPPNLPPLPNSAPPCQSTRATCWWWTISPAPPPLGCAGRRSCGQAPRTSIHRASIARHRAEPTLPLPAPRRRIWTRNSAMPDASATWSRTTSEGGIACCVLGGWGVAAHACWTSPLQLSVHLL